MAPRQGNPTSRPRWRRIERRGGQPPPLGQARAGPYGVRSSATWFVGAPLAGACDWRGNIPTKVFAGGAMPGGLKRSRILSPARSVIIALYALIVLRLFASDLQI